MRKAERGWTQLVDRKFPTAQIHIDKIRDIFEKYANKEHVLGLNELAEMFIEISKRMTALPAVRPSVLPSPRVLTITADGPSCEPAGRVPRQEVL